MKARLVNSYLFLLGLIVLSTEGWAVEKPAIHVSFEYELASPFDRQLGPNRRSQLSTCVINRMIAKAQRKWGFVNWISGPAPAERMASWKMKLKLVGPIVDSTQDGFKTTLHHYRSLTGENFDEFEQTESNETVYLPGSDYSYHNLQKLEKDISNKLDEQLNILLKDTEYVIPFMNDIPIAREIIAEEGEGIIIPIKYSDLQAGSGTVLEVSFENSANGRKGHIELQPEEFDEPGQFNSYVIGRVEEFQLRPLIIQTPVYWDPQFTDVFASARNELAKMKHYEHLSLEEVTGANQDGDVAEPDPPVAATAELECSLVRQ